MSLTSKITCVAILLCSLLLIVATGRVNIRNFEKVQHSIEEIYKDRLVVKGLIFELSSLLNRKEIAIISGDQNFFNRTNESINSQIADHLQAFRETYLTTNEEVTLNRFSEGIKNLESIEKKMNLLDGVVLTRVESSELKSRIKSLQDDLRTLSSIQLSEGERKLRTSERAVKSMHEFESIENYAVLTLGFLILVFILVPGSRKQQNGQASTDISASAG